jgi:hypothetical protein
MTPVTENLRQAEMGNRWASDVTLSPVTGIAEIWMSRPIMQGNTFLGMVVIPLHMQGLEYFMHSREYRTGRYFTAIADTTGVVAYSNRPGYLGKSLVELGMAPSMSEFKTGEMFEYNSSEIGRATLAHALVSEETGWISISGIDLASTLPKSETIVMGILPFVFGLLAVGVVIFTIVVRTLKPLDHLAYALKDIAQG